MSNGGLDARVLILSAQPVAAVDGVAALDGIAIVLGDAGYAVDVRDHADGAGRLPADAPDYDVVVLDPRTVAARSAPTDLGDVDLGRLRIDADRRLVMVDGASVRLSAREFTLLHHLAAHPGTVFSRESLLRAVWGSAWRTEGSVTEYVRRLRLVLAPLGLGECIVTRKGFGYSFDPDAVS